MTDISAQQQSVQLFDNPDFGKVRVLMRDGEPWFVAKDVCDCLEMGNMHSSLALLDDDEKGIHTVETPGGPQKLSIISESGMYSLVMRSRKPEAKKFRRWVTGEVLPTIRKTGQYSLFQNRVPKTFPEALRMLADAEEEKALAIEQRDRAVREKSWIGSRREATALSTASAAVRRANNWKASAGELADVAEAQQGTIDDLNDQLGQGKTWKATKSIGWLLDFFADSRGMWSSVGKKLTALGKAMGLPPKELETSEYTVKLHHIDVIEAFRCKLVADPAMLAKYRKA